MRIAVVSGGGTGIGAATAKALVKEGFAVTIVGRRPETLAATAAAIDETMDRPAPLRVIAADLTRPGDVARVIDEIGDDHVDVLVNNAGGYRGAAGSELADVANQWRDNFDTNVMTAVLLTEAMRPRLTRPGGTVVFLSSIAAQRGGGGAYSAAKAALHGWAYDLARNLGPDGTTVNVVAPGYVQDTEFFVGRMTPEGHANRVAQTLVGRAGTPADIADAIRYLVQARYVTGQVIGVNGGSVLGR